MHHVSKIFIARQAHNKIFNLDSEYLISTMPPKKKPRRDISGLKNQPKLATDSSHINEHPRCQALFISINHLLMPDALEAFEMNKSNGGVQRRQKDTIIQPISRIPWQSPKDDDGIWGEKRAPANSRRARLQCGSPSCQMHTRLSV